MRRKVGREQLHPDVLEQAVLAAIENTDMGDGEEKTMQELQKKIGSMTANLDRMYILEYGLFWLWR